MNRRCLYIALFVSGLNTAFYGDEALDLGSRRELFVDHYLIDTLSSAELRRGHPVREEVALNFDAAWEGRYCGYVSVVPVEDGYLMYYRGLPIAGADGSNNEVTCVAESADGLLWSRPRLTLHPLPDHPENNVILAASAPYSHNFAPFLDTNPEASEEARYKALAGTSKTGLAAFASVDGYSWRLAREAVITEGAFDSQNVAFWSPSEQCYVAYFRTWSKGGYKGVRSVSRSTSKDFVSWSEPEAMTFGDTPLEHLYTNQTLAYPRAPHIYLSLAARFMPGRQVATAEEAAALGIQGNYGGDCSDNVLMTSRGGTVYDRTFMEGFLKPGIGMANWTSRTNYPARGIVETGPEEMSFYVQENYGQPTARIRRYSLRPDGFASLYAGYAGGEMGTHPVTFSGEGLYLNFATSAAGDVRVEIQDPTGKPLPGFELENAAPLIGNELERRVRWESGNSLASLAGTPVRLRFVMKDAEIYALQFK